MDSGIGPEPPTASAEKPDYAVAILGAGFSGIGMGVRLQQAGETSFVLLEKAGAVGGTWRDNVYPGAGCDIASHLYSFSFAPNPDWSQVYAPQPEILAYIEAIVRDHGLAAHIRFGAEVTKALWDEAAGLWRIETADGHSLTARAFVTACGQLSQPALPVIPGRETFAGAAFHSARWRSDISLAGKRVAVIGSGASAVQLVPEIAPQVAKLMLFQRSPGWVVPKMNRAYGEAERSVLRARPDTLQASRAQIYEDCEKRHAIFGSQDSDAARSLAKASRAMLEAQVDDPDLRRRLTPDHAPGCKRLLISDDFYSTLARPNVALVTDRIESIGPKGVVTRDGSLWEAEIIIYATGFKSLAFLSPTILVGRSGVTLAEAWGQAPRAYLGICAPAMPNLFMLYGPNTGLGHNSMLAMIEAQIDYVLQGLALLGEGVRALEVTAEAAEAFDLRLQDALQQTAWATACSSWYKSVDGRIISNWPGTTNDYIEATRRLDPGDFHQTLNTSDLNGVRAPLSAGAQ